MKRAQSDPPALSMSGTEPDYELNNPLKRAISVYESLQLALSPEFYQQDELQALLPLESVRLYGPGPGNAEVLDFAQQDFVDFQKQNVCDFTLGDALVVRGWVTVGSWTGAFLRISYRGGPDSRLSKASGTTLGASIKAYLKVGDQSAPHLLTLPYHLRSDRYELEIWADPGKPLADFLKDIDPAPVTRGELITLPGIVWGVAQDFQRPQLDGTSMPGYKQGHLMHPINSLRIELAWTDASETFWDSREGQNYSYEFSMMIRGWNNYLKVGASSQPHGGIGNLEYRNLLSNYFEYQNSGELGRTPQPWSKDAFGTKGHGGRPESFFAVDYMDLHIVRKNAGIGLHRHRDNQEIFMVLEHEVYMMAGDWLEMPHRQRALEIRMLHGGHFAFLKPGQLHGLLNPTDEDVPFLMFGGYD